MSSINHFVTNTVYGCYLTHLLLLLKKFFVWVFCSDVLPPKICKKGAENFTTFISSKIFLCSIFFIFSGRFFTPWIRIRMKADADPHDRFSDFMFFLFRLVWLVFYLLGMTTLLPWNFFIAVNDYWNYKVKTTCFRSAQPDSTLSIFLKKLLH